MSHQEEKSSSLFQGCNLYRLDCTGTVDGSNPKGHLAKVIVAENIEALGHQQGHVLGFFTPDTIARLFPEIIPTGSHTICEACKLPLLEASKKRHSIKV